MRFIATPTRWQLLAVAGLALLGIGAFRPATDGDTEVLRRIVLRVRQFYQTAHAETAYLHLDKDVYTAGETVWLRA